MNKRNEHELRRLFVGVTVMALSWMGSSAQTNLTRNIENYSFEKGFDGWRNDGFQIQDNTAFSLKSGDYYAEKWTASDGAVGDASLLQTISGLEAGTYKLTVRAQNIQEGSSQLCRGVTVILGDSALDVNVAKTYTMYYTVVTGSADIGLSVKNATGNWVACDHFQLYYTYDSGAVDMRLGQLIDEAKRLIASKPSYTGDRLNALQDAIASAESKLGIGIADGVSEVGARLKDAIWQFRLAVATKDDPIDMTSCIQNAGFEKGLAGWVNVGFQAQGNAAFGLKRGTTYVEKWIGRGQSLGNGSLTQGLADMEHGRYILKVRAQNIQEDAPQASQSGAVLIGEAGQTTIATAGDYELEFVSIENTLNIGILLDGATGNWFACDDFRLYFAGNGDDVVNGEMRRRIDLATSLLECKMNKTIQTTLKNCLDKASMSTDENFSNNAALLRIAISAAGKSVEAFSALAEAIRETEQMLEEGWANGTEDAEDALAEARSVNEDLNSSNEELHEQVKRLEGARLELKLANGTGTPPNVTTDVRYTRGSTCIFGRMTATGKNIIEQGFCYSTKNVPTVADSRSVRWLDNAGRVYVMDNLTPGTVYYIRAYAITSTDDVGYGEVVKAVTIPKANIGWNYEYNGSKEENDRIVAGMTAWCAYWSKYTSLPGYFPSVRIATGTPTADCGYGGYTRVGTNPNYQSQTMLTHEMLHGIGVGTMSIWTGQGGMRANGNRGLWLGDRVSSVLRFWDNNNSSMLDGDQTHMWPWGFNYSSEDPHTEQGYIINAMIAQALGEDGLAPCYGFVTPYYAFEQDDNRKYYLTNEDGGHGLGTAMLSVARGGTLQWKKISAADALENDSVAWFIVFNASNQFYSMKNAATGRYLVYDGTFHLQTKATEEVPSNGWFQMLKGRVDATIHSAKGDLVRRGYWIAHNEGTFTSPTLTAANNGLITNTGFDLGNWATTERWVILSTKDLTFMSERINTNKVLNDLKVNNVSLPGFYSDRHDYIYEVDPESAVNRYSIGFEKATGYDGSVRTVRPQTIPGVGTATATSNSGEVDEYKILFLKNHIIHWDADGATGIGSEPYRYGWGPKLNTTWASANMSLVNAFLDPYEGDYNGYTLQTGAYKYNYRRIIKLSYPKTDTEYTYTFSGLDADSLYLFGCNFAADAGTRVPQLTVKVRETESGQTLAEGTFVNLSAKSLKNINLTFATLGTADKETKYSICFTVSQAESVLTLGDLLVTPADNLVVGINEVTHNNDTGDDEAVYNLSGMKVGDSYKGIVIKNGRKYVR